MTTPRPVLYSRLRRQPLDRESWHALHDDWERIWLRTSAGTVRWYALRGLIQLSAAGVTLCDGRTRGAAKLIDRAQANLDRSLESGRTAQLAVLGRRLDDTPDAAQFARELLGALEALDRYCDELGLI